MEKIFNDFIDTSKKAKKCEDPELNKDASNTHILLDFTKRKILTVNKVNISPVFQDTLLEFAKVFGAYCRCDGKFLFEEYFNKYRGKIFEFLKNIPKGIKLKKE